MPLILTCLAQAHEKRFDLQHEPGDIHKSIEYRIVVLTLTSDDDLSLPRLLYELAVAYWKRFMWLADIGDIEKAMENISLALKLIPEGHPDLPYRLSHLALLYRARFQHFGNREDIEKAIKYDSQAVANIGNDHPILPGLVAQLGTSHSDRFERSGELQDLERAIDYQSHALTLMPDDYPHLAHCLGNLAISHRRRFQRLGELNDLDQAITHDTRALALTPDDHPDVPGHLANLALSHRYRFKRLGELSDLEQTIKLKTRALALIPDDHPHLSVRLANLAVSYGDRFKRLGNLSDLEQSIKHQTRALTLTSDGHPQLYIYLDNLAVSYNDRFRRLGDLSDLEQAIRHQTRALLLTPDDHPGLSVNLADLSVSHKDRFRHLGEMGDLEQAIKYDTRALALTPDDHPDLLHRLGNLAVSLNNRFRRLGELGDLEHAIKLQTRALALTPDNHSHLPTCLSHLAVSHSARFKSTGELSDLEQAINLNTRALALTPDDHPHLSDYLGHLLASHSDRFRQLGKLSDLEQAIEYGTCALAAITPDHPDSCMTHCNHAVLYIHYYHHSHDPTYLQRSLSLFRRAFQSISGGPRDRFRHACQWASNASKHNILAPIEAFQVTIGLLPQFIWLGASADQRFQDLKSIDSLATDAAYAAIVSSSYPLALEWLEHARCIIWNQNLMLRSPLDQLLASHPGLANRLQTVAAALHSTSSTSREFQASSNSITPEQVGQDHRRLAKEYEDLLAQARIQPGFEDFLRPLTADRLTHAARNGPIVIINCHRDRCDTLIIIPKQLGVIHVPLPNFNAHKAQAARSELQMSVAGLRLPERAAQRRPMIVAGQELEFGNTLAVLWHDVVKPILDHLGYTRNSTGDLHHITWCPTGAMTFLPLHAAGDYDQPRSRAFDYAVSSYIPTLTAILEATTSSLSPDSRVLAIGQTATLGHAPLPGTALELDCVRARTQGKVKYTQLMNDQATVTTVLDEMEQHNWIHLACHAHQNVVDPKKSGFFLSDGVLDLDEINRRSLKGKGLAFLSACQTATGDKELPDEAVHLASGMLMAGYSSVIATMWSVGDSDAPLVADKVYSELMKKGTLGNGEAGRALHDAVGELRASVGEKDFGRWVPFIHIGS